MSWPSLPLPSLVAPVPTEPPWNLGPLPEAPPADLVENLTAEVTLDPDTSTVNELVPIPEASFEVDIMAAQGDYGLAIAAYLWAPLTISHIEFDVRYMNNARRV